MSSVRDLPATRTTDGGSRVVDRLKEHGVTHLFTLCGGHISPLLVAARRSGIRVVDTRHEATAGFAADALARLTGKVGVAAVTAGPGVTNVLTPAVNARLAQSPLLVLGGATATILRGRGSLQDIDQMSLAAAAFRTIARAERLGRLEPLLEQLLWAARDGVPGPVFLELPVDLLYPESVVRDWYGVEPRKGRGSPLQWIERQYLRWHLRRIFRGASRSEPLAAPTPPEPEWLDLWRAVRALQRAERPVLLVGSQALIEPSVAPLLQGSIEALGVPVYLSGSARGLLGREHPLLLRHRRREALREADCVILAGVPCDFRLDYGRTISRRAVLLAANRSREELFLNRRAQVPLVADPARFLLRLVERVAPRAPWRAWVDHLRKRDAEREAEIAEQASSRLPDGVQPLALLRELDARLPQEALVIGDGGDFVGTAAYTVRPPGPLSWLDPGPFGTLGVGAGFALGAWAARPQSEVWVLWGDGSVAYSLAEFDTFLRHGVPLIGVVGNDGSWAQIARDQVELLGDPVGTELLRSDYHRAAEALGGVGFLVEREEEIPAALESAQREARAGKAVLVNVRLGRSLFRKGSISL